MDQLNLFDQQAASEPWVEAKQPNPKCLEAAIATIHHAGDLKCRPLEPAPPELAAPDFSCAVGDVVVVLPFTDQNGRRHPTFVGQKGTVIGFNLLGMALIKFGHFHPYPAGLWRVVKMD